MHVAAQLERCTHEPTFGKLVYPTAMYYLFIHQYVLSGVVWRLRRLPFIIANNNNTRSTFRRHCPQSQKFTSVVTSSAPVAVTATAEQRHPYVLRDILVILFVILAPHTSEAILIHFVRGARCTRAYTLNTFVVLSVFVVRAFELLNIICDVLSIESIHLHKVTQFYVLPSRARFQNSDKASALSEFSGQFSFES